MGGWKDSKRETIKKRGEAGSIDVAKLPEQREHSRSILKGYNECDIFNCDETALFWKMEPRTTLARTSVSGKKLLMSEGCGNSMNVPSFPFM